MADCSCSCRSRASRQSPTSIAGVCTLIVWLLLFIRQTTTFLYSRAFVCKSLVYFHRMSLRRTYSCEHLAESNILSCGSRNFGCFFSPGDIYMTNPIDLFIKSSPRKNKQSRTEIAISFFPVLITSNFKYLSPITGFPKEIPSVFATENSNADALSDTNIMAVAKIILVKHMRCCSKIGQFRAPQPVRTRLRINLVDSRTAITTNPLRYSIYYINGVFNTVYRCIDNGFGEHGRLAANAAMQGLRETLKPLTSFGLGQKGQSVTRVCGLDICDFLPMR